jgi:hypothetical protein
MYLCIILWHDDDEMMMTNKAPVINNNKTKQYSLLDYHLEMFHPL